jgi:hypothetical protein
VSESEGTKTGAQPKAHIHVVEKPTFVHTKHEQKYSQDFHISPFDSVYQNSACSPLLQAEWFWTNGEALQDQAKNWL